MPTLWTSANLEMLVGDTYQALARRDEAAALFAALLVRAEGLDAQGRLPPAERAVIDVARQMIAICDRDRPE